MPSLFSAVTHTLSHLNGEWGKEKNQDRDKRRRQTERRKKRSPIREPVENAGIPKDNSGCTVWHWKIPAISQRKLNLNSVVPSKLLSLTFIAPVAQEKDTRSTDRGRGKEMPVLYICNQNGEDKKNTQNLDYSCDTLSLCKTTQEVTLSSSCTKVKRW